MVKAEVFFTQSDAKQIQIEACFTIQIKNLNCQKSKESSIC